MQCQKCGEEYPSVLWFNQADLEKGWLVCAECIKTSSAEEMDAFRSQQPLPGPASSRHAVDANHSMRRMSLAVARLAFRILASSLLGLAVMLAALSVVLIWRAPAANSPEIFVQAYHAGDVTSLAFSPDGAMLASTSIDATIKLWDTRSKMLLRTIAGRGAHVSSVCLLRRGSRFAAAVDQTVKLWDTETGALLRVLSGHRLRISSVAVSPDGRQLVSASRDGTIRLWDVESGSLLRTLKGHGGAVVAVSFCPDGRRFASAGIDKAVRLWDARNGSLLQTLTKYATPLTAVACAARGDVVSSADEGGTIILWRSGRGELLVKPYEPVSSEKRVSSLAFSPNGRILAAANDDGTIDLWETENGDFLQALAGLARRLGAHQAFLSVAFAPDGRTIASGDDNGVIDVWDVKSREPHGLRYADRYLVGAVAYSRGGRMFATGHASEVYLWDAASRSVLRTIKAPKGLIESASFSSEDDMLATASTDGSVKLWEVASGSLLRTLQEPASSRPVLSVDFAPGHRMLASGGIDGVVRIWDIESGALLHTLYQHMAEVFSVSFSPDGNTLASGSADGTARLWNAKSGLLLRTLSEGNGVVSSVAFSSNGRTLASTLAAPTFGHTVYAIKLWDTTAGVLLRTLSGHEGMVHAVAFSPQGHTLVSGSGDGTARVWDAESGALLRTLAGHEGRVGSVAYSRDGRQITTVADDGAIRFWSAESGELLQVQLRGEESLVFHPAHLFYHSSQSPGAREPAAVRFNNRTRPVYPLEYYRKELWIHDSRAMQDPAVSAPRIRPKPLRAAYDMARTRQGWLAAGLTLYLLIITVALLAVQRLRQNTAQSNTPRPAR